MNAPCAHGRTTIGSVFTAVSSSIRRSSSQRVSQNPRADTFLNIADPVGTPTGCLDMPPYVTTTPSLASMDDTFTHDATAHAVERESHRG